MIRRLSLFALSAAALALIQAGPARTADAPAPAATAPAAASPAPASPAPAAPAPPPMSLMFSPSEVAAIEKAFVDRDRAKKEAAAAEAQGTAEAAVKAAVTVRPAEEKVRVPNIYVSAVLDFGGGDWTVWANGMRITPDRQPPLFHIDSVKGNTVEITVPAEGNAQLRLEPYQTWRSRQHDVVEGIVP